MYSLKKGIYKGLGAGITALIAILVVTGFSDIELTTLIQQYLFPLIEGVTTVGVLKIVHNWVKFQKNKNK